MRLTSIVPNGAPSRLFASLFAAGLLYALSLVARPDIHFLSRPFIEDSFYSLSVARSLGEGGGISIDGVTPTNGVQPLICFLYAPAFAITGGDVFDALRVAVALQAALAALAALALAWFVITIVRVPESDSGLWRERPADSSEEAPSLRAADRTLRIARGDTGNIRPDLFWIVAGTVMVSYSLLVHLMNGLETSLAAGLTFASTAFYVERIARRPEAPLSEFARLGALLGIGVLARIDVAILSAVFAGWYFWTTPRRSRRVAPFAGAAMIGLVSFAVSLPWWLYNLIGFGHVMPTSGLAQMDLLTDRPESVALVVRGISNALTLVVHVPGDLDGIVAYAGLVIFAVVASAFAVVPRFRRWAVDAFTQMAKWTEPRLAAPILAFLALLAAYYTLFFGAPHFISRYLTSLWLTITAALVVTLYALWRTARPTRTRALLFGSLIAVALGVSFWAQSRSFTEAGLHTNVMLYPAEWIGAHTAEGDRIGMFQSGTTGFLYRRVTNLDGKVNPRALEALRSNTVAQLADSANFDYIIDLDFYTRHIFHDARMRSRYQPVDTLPFGFIVWRRRG